MPIDTPNMNGPNAAEDPPRFDVREQRLTFPIPYEVVAGDHILRVLIDAAGPRDAAAHGEATFVHSSSQTIQSSLAHVTVKPSVYAISHAQSGWWGGTVVTIHGSGFSPDTMDHQVALAGRECKVTSAEHHLIRCTLARPSEGGTTPSGTAGGENEALEKGNRGEVSVVVKGINAASQGAHTFALNPALSRQTATSRCVYTGYVMKLASTHAQMQQCQKQ